MNSHYLKKQKKYMSNIFWSTIKYRIKIQTHATTQLHKKYHFRHLWLFVDIQSYFLSKINAKQSIYLFIVSTDLSSIYISQLYNNNIEIFIKINFNLTNNKIDQIKKENILFKTKSIQYNIFKQYIKNIYLVTLCISN